MDIILTKIPVINFVLPDGTVGDVCWIRSWPEYPGTPWNLTVSDDKELSIDSSGDCKVVSSTTASSGLRLICYAPNKWVSDVIVGSVDWS